MIIDQSDKTKLVAPSIEKIYCGIFVHNLGTEDTAGNEQGQRRHHSKWCAVPLRVRCAPGLVY